MAEARQREAWQHTAALLAMLANTHRDPKKSRTYRPSDFTPFPPTSTTHRPPAAAPKGDIRLLKLVFVDSRPGRQ